MTHTPDDVRRVLTEGSIQGIESFDDGDTVYVGMADGGVVALHLDRGFGGRVPDGDEILGSVAATSDARVPREAADPVRPRGEWFDPADGGHRIGGDRALADRAAAWLLWDDPDVAREVSRWLDGLGWTPLTALQAGEAAGGLGGLLRRWIGEGCAGAGGREAFGARIGLEWRPRA